MQGFIRDSLTFITKSPKLIKVAFLMTFGHTVAYVYLIAYFFNSAVRIKYNAGADTSSILLYLFNTIQNLNLWGLIIIFVLIVLVGYFWIYPVGEATLIHGIKEEGSSLSKSLNQGFKNFFSMLEYRSMSSFLGIYTIITVIVRLWVMGILESFVIKPIIGIWLICSLFTIFFRPYLKYYIVIDNDSPFDAMKNSVMLTLGNIKLTFKGVITEQLLMLRYFLAIIVVIAVPVLLLIGAVKAGIIDYRWVEAIIWSIVGLLLLIIVYMNGIFETFLTKYRYEIFKKAEKNLG
ncbi:hypothetical protein AGMMS50249_3090 [candidate division SR1 bacterium]|nr:hypothetical protein AGMMS50249_3090 [candidate division SR1 bacterium]